MGALVKTPSMPGPDPKVAEVQAKQEAQLDQQEREKMAQIAARQRARRVGGRRMLLSPMRENAETGIKETLG